MQEANNKINKYDYLIVGAGLFGSVFAHEAHKRNKRCLVIEKRPWIGGNIYCENINKIHVHKYGAHIFHTDKKNIWNYVNSLVKFNQFINSPLASSEGKLYNLPFNMNTFYQLWGVQTPMEAKIKLEEQRHQYRFITNPQNLEEQALKICGSDIYYRLIKGYTEKQWGRAATKLPAFIVKRIPFRFTFDNNYFNDPYQGIPIGGYNRLINALLEGIEVRTNVNYLDDRDQWDSIAEKVLFTGCIDEYFNFCYGKLEYRSLRFETHYLNDISNYQGNAVINYCDSNIPYTRVIEHKHFEFGTQDSTIITYEFPEELSIGKEPYYPINDEKNTTIFRKYQTLAKANKKVLFGGRLAQYTYADMDDTVEAALSLWNKEIQSTF